MRKTSPLVIATALAALGLAACGSPATKQNAGGGKGLAQLTAPPGLPKKPVTLNIIDAGGDLQLSQAAIDAFAHQHRNLVGKVTYSKSTGPELAGKIQAQQRAGRAQYNVVVAGYGEIANGVQLGLWQRLFPNFSGTLGDVQSKYLPGAQKMARQIGGYALETFYNPNGPVLLYDPKIGTAPNTPQGLLAWAKAHPKKLEYARPANSGPGRTLLMGLPYVLHDKDPRDPVNGWAKTWAFLAQLGRYIDHYPSGTAVTMQDLTSGAVDIVPASTGWDVNTRALGVVPANFKAQTFRGFHWVADAHYMAIPRGVPAAQQAVILQLMKSMLTPAAQAYAYDDGYFYPGPAVKGVSVSMAPAKSRQVIAKYGRPEYQRLFATVPVESQLDAKSIVAMFDKWDRDIGGGKVKE
jgi:putative spermidine/putrescine transport system substrate-binding protein